MTSTSNPDGDAILPTSETQELNISMRKSQKKENSDYSNEYVLNFAFVSFVLFTMLQFVFALAARSQSMLTDCAAMTVDCVSYLINFLAERWKHTKTDQQQTTATNTTVMQQLSPSERHYRKKMRLLLLELAPPFISVSTLVVVTVLAIKQAVVIILDTNPDHKGPAPNLGLMLLFSALNFVLDGVNVLCFAKADQAKGLQEGLTAAMHPQEYVVEKQEHHSDRIHRTGDQSSNNNTPTNQDVVSGVNENTYLLSSAAAAAPSNKNKNTIKGSATDATIEESDEEDDTATSSQSSRGLNLNMCSAWTHICADTLRSIAVLIAAGFASLFPDLLSPADADSYGAIVVSIIIIFSLGPLIEGLYFTAWEIYHLQREHNLKKKQGFDHPDDLVLALSV